MESLAQKQLAVLMLINKIDSTGGSGARLSETHNRDDTFVMNSTNKLEMQYNKL